MVCVSSRSASTSVTDSRQAMRGSIEKYSTTAGDRWRVRYELPPGPDGRRRQRTKRGFLRQRDADRALREAIGSVQDGTYVEPNQDTVAQWLEECPDGADRSTPALPGVTAASSPPRPGLRTARTSTR
jgi:hypothetical protein